MNVLDKIEKLRLDRGWSVYRLAEKAGRSVWNDFEPVFCGG